MAWFWRGAQSAFFYYVSCAPCSNYAFERRRSKQKARVEKETKQLMKNASRHSNGQIVIPEGCEGARQDLITGVGAFTTNIYWREDMILGPHPRRGRNRPDLLDGLATSDSKNSKDNANSRKSRATTADSLDSEGLGSTDTLRGLDIGREQVAWSGLPLEPVETLRSSESKDQSLRTRYQRPDELLWGDSTIEKNWAYYARGRNPEVNEITPPVISTTPSDSSHARWMLQPPPPARVMDGRQIPVTRRQSAGASSHASAISKRSGGSHVGSTMHTADRAHLCVLGERMTELSEPTKPRTSQWPRQDKSEEINDRNSRLPAPRYSQHVRNRSSSSTDWSDPAQSPSLENRSKTLRTSRPKSAPRKGSRNDDGFDSAWQFPRKFVQADGPGGSGMTPLSALMQGNAQVDGYSSEPDRLYANGFATNSAIRDFASSRKTSSEIKPSAAGASSEPSSGTSIATGLQSIESRPQSDSTIATTDESQSGQSSLSSLHPLDIMVAPPGATIPSSDHKKSQVPTEPQLTHVTTANSREGLTY